MKNQNPHCVFPAPSEIELSTIAGTPHGDPATALRVRVQPSAETDGYVRLEQLAWSADLGWYCQKSFVIPGPLVRDLITQLRKADCFLPKVETDPLAPIPFRPADPLPHDAPDQAQRRDA